MLVPGWQHGCREGHRRYILALSPPSQEKSLNLFVPSSSVVRGEAGSAPCLETTRLFSGFWLLQECGGSQGAVFCAAVPSTLVCRVTLLAAAPRGTGLFSTFGERLQGQTGMQNWEASSPPSSSACSPSVGHPWGLCPQIPLLTGSGSVQL